MRWWPRPIRWQMLLGLALIEVLSIGLFTGVLVRFQQQDIRHRAETRLSSQADSIVQQAQEALRKQSPDWIALSVRMMSQSPSVSRVRITDPAGVTLFETGDNGLPRAINDRERAQIASLRGQTSARIFAVETDRWESVEAIYSGGKLYGFAWILSDPNWDTEQLRGVLREVGLFALIWIGASAVLVILLARGISRPLDVLHRGTRELASLPEVSNSFPLPVTTDNEIGDLIVAFNRMVAAIEEQRAGLRDTLSLLDSMLANAPVGFAYFDRRLRFVRVNQVFAELVQIPLSRHLGRTPSELLPPEVAQPFEKALEAVFTSEEPLNDVDIQGPGAAGPWNWLMSAYPVRTTPNQVRWAGIILRDVSERVRSEEALRKTEKLAATGRLAASIAHEINNPLEGLINLLYLLRIFPGISAPALEYVELAEQQTKRIAEIAQKTLRFYRASTLPARARVAELVLNILDLYKARMHTLNIQWECDCDPELTLFCYEGEIRQVIANFIGNAVDATAAGGKLMVRVRRSHGWRTNFPGLRFTIADTGTGMTDDVIGRIFEPFFTTKEATGTGLGLWVSQEIIEKHNGLVHVRSRASGNGAPSSGTVFQLFLPDDETLTSRRGPDPEAF